MGVKLGKNGITTPGLSVVIKKFDRSYDVLYVELHIPGHGSVVISTEDWMMATLEILCFASKEARTAFAEKVGKLYPHKF